MLPPGVEVIPPEVRKLLCCNCMANSPCGKGNCTCRNANIGCSIFCKCSTSKSCVNPWTVKNDKKEDDNDNDNSEEEEQLLIATDE